MAEQYGTNFNSNHYNDEVFCVGEPEKEKKPGAIEITVTRRNGEWVLSDYTKYVLNKIIPETTVKDNSELKE